MTGRVADFEVDPQQPERLLRGHRRRRRVEKREPRQRLDADLRQRRLVQHVLHPDRSEGLERPLARHGRELESAQLDDRRRRLQVHRRRRDVDARRPRRTPSTSATCRSIRATPNVVYVAAQGPLWSVGRRSRHLQDDRRRQDVEADSTPGISPDTGGNEVHIDPTNPDVLYASMWQRRRGVGQMIGGGPESGIYKSTNGGATWTKLTNGLPKGDMGRIAMGVDPKAKPTRVYALINALGRRPASIDRTTRARRGRGMGAPLGAARAASAGAGSRLRRGRGGAGGAGRGGGGGGRGGGAPGVYRGGDPGYYNEIYVDPVRPDTIWSANTNLEWSRDGGKTFSAVPEPERRARRPPRRVVRHERSQSHHASATTAASTSSWDEGRTWRHFTNLPVTQFYRVSVDNAKPFYNVCGGAQDNGSHVRSEPDAAQRRHPHQRLVRRRRRRRLPDAQRSGRSEHRLRDVAERRDPAAGSAHRPVSQAIRPRAGGPGDGGRRRWRRRRRARRRRAHELGRDLHRQPASRRRGSTGAANCLYRTDDRGDTWTRDQRRPDAQPRLRARFRSWASCGIRETTVAWNNATTTLSTIVSLDESPLLEGLLYVGTDDGNLHITEDGGKTWRKTTQFGDVAGRLLRLGRVRVAARRQRRLRHAEQLAARRLQAVHLPQRRSRPDVHVDRRQLAGSASGVVDHPGSRQRQPDFRRHRVRAVLHGGRRHALGAAQGRPAGRRRSATWTCRSARTISCSARSAAASTCSTTTARCARSPRRRSRRRPSCSRCGTRISSTCSTQQTRGVGQRDDAESAVRRACSRITSGRASAADLALAVTIRAGRQVRRIDVAEKRGPASRRVEPARGAAGAGSGRRRSRWRRRWRWRRSAVVAAGAVSGAGASRRPAAAAGGAAAAGQGGGGGGGGRRSRRRRAAGPARPLLRLGW